MFDLKTTERLLKILRALHETEPASGRRATIRQCAGELQRLGDYIAKAEGRKRKEWDPQRETLKEQVIDKRTREGKAAKARPA